MKYADINEKFTSYVSAYINAGYHFDTGSMSGSEGIAHVDLLKGDYAVRVSLDKSIEEEHGAYCLTIRVGAKKAGTKADKEHSDILWNSDFEEITKVCFYQISQKYNEEVYGSYDEMVAAFSKRRERSFIRYKTRERKKYLGTKANLIAYRMLKTRDGCKSIRRKDVMMVYPVIDSNGAKHYYAVVYKKGALALN